MDELQKTRRPKPSYCIYIELYQWNSILFFEVLEQIDSLHFKDYDSPAGLHCQSVLTDRLQKAHNNAVMVLCVLLSHAFRVRLGGARLRALISFCISLSTLLVLPPLFDSNLVRLLLITKGIVNHDAIYCALFPCTFPASSTFYSDSFITRFRCVLIDSRHPSAAVPLWGYSTVVLCAG